MGGPGAAGGRRRWSCRAGEGGGAVGVGRRVAGQPVAEERGAGAATRRAGGFPLVDKQQSAHEVSVSRKSSRSTTEKEYLSSGSRQFKGSSGNSTGYLPSEHTKNASQRTSFSWPRENISNGNSFHVSSNISDYGLPNRPKFHFSEDTSNNVKHPRPPKSSGGFSDFSYRLVKSAGRSNSLVIDQASANYSLSEKMSLLRQQQHGRCYKNQNHLFAVNLRHKIAYSGGASNMFRKEEVHRQSDSSVGRHCQVLLDNALVRQNQLYSSQPLNEESPEESWSSTTEKIACFSSSVSNDDLPVLLSSDTSDTSDNSKLSSLGIIASHQWKMTFKKVRCPVAAHINSLSVANRKEIDQPSPVSVLEPNSLSVANRKEIDQPSPVSVLEPPAEDFSYGGNARLGLAYPHDSQLRLEPVQLPCVGTVAQLVSVGGNSDYLFSEMEDSQNDKTIQLVEDILEEFGDAEEREFSYLLDTLIVSGIHGTEEDQLYKVCQSLDCPAGYDVFEKLENKYARVSEWSRLDRKLVFDMVNSILSEILAPCLNMHPWVNTAKNAAPMWGSEGLLEKVLQMLAHRREELVLSKPKPEKKAFDQKWQDLADCIDKAGKEVEKMVTDDLLEELFLELMSS